MLRLASLVSAFALVAFDAAAQEAPPPPPDPFALAASLDDAALAAETITSAAFASSVQQLSATNSGNTVTGETVETGDIVLDAGSLSGFNGIGNFVMNTGNNNNLQGSVSVVVIVAPP